MFIDVRIKIRRDECRPSATIAQIASQGTQGVVDASIQPKCFVIAVRSVLRCWLPRTLLLLASGMAGVRRRSDALRQGPAVEDRARGRRCRATSSAPSIRPTSGSRRLPKPVNRAVRAAKLLILEVARTDDMPIRMARLMMLTDGRRLEDILGKDLFKRFAKVAKQYGLPANVLQRIKPWAALMTISLPPQEKARQAAGRLPLDSGARRPRPEAWRAGLRARDGGRAARPVRGPARSRSDLDAGGGDPRQQEARPGVRTHDSVVSRSVISRA